MNDLSKYEKQYDESKFWKKVAGTAKKVGIKAIYCALVLYYSLQSPKISTKDKRIIWGALGYFILPLDLIPDFLPVGYTDDMAALMLALYKVARNITPEVKKMAEDKVATWFKDFKKSDIIIENFNDHDATNVDEQ